MTAPERDPALPDRPQADDVVLFEDRLHAVVKSDADDPNLMVRDVPGVQLFGPTPEEAQRFRAIGIDKGPAIGEPTSAGLTHTFNRRDILGMDPTALRLLEQHLRLATIDNVRHALRAKIRVWVAKRRVLPPGGDNSDLREFIEAQCFQNGPRPPAP